MFSHRFLATFLLAFGAVTCSATQDAVLARYSSDVDRLCVGTDKPLAFNVPYRKFLMVDDSAFLSGYNYATTGDFMYVGTSKFKGRLRCSDSLDVMLYNPATNSFTINSSNPPVPSYFTTWIKTLLSNILSRKSFPLNLPDPVAAASFVATLFTSSDSNSATVSLTAANNYPSTLVVDSSTTSVELKPATQVTQTLPSDALASEPAIDVSDMVSAYYTQYVSYKGEAQLHGAILMKQDPATNVYTVGYILYRVLRRKNALRVAGCPGTWCVLQHQFSAQFAAGTLSSTGIPTTPVPSSTPTPAPSVNATTPGANATTPGANATTPGAPAAAPVANATTPGAPAASPGAPAASPGANATAPNATVTPSAPGTGTPDGGTPNATTSGSPAPTDGGFIPTSNGTDGSTPSSPAPSSTGPSTPGDGGNTTPAPLGAAAAPVDSSALVTGSSSGTPSIPTGGSTSSLVEENNSFLGGLARRQLGSVHDRASASGGSYRCYYDSSCRCVHCYYS